LNDDSVRQKEIHRAIGTHVIVPDYLQIGQLFEVK
jgi:hypothetical protein